MSNAGYDPKKMGIANLKGFYRVTMLEFSDGQATEIQTDKYGRLRQLIDALGPDVSDNNATQLKTSIYDADGDGISIETRKQTPTGKALNVQIGPGDVISNIPVFVDFEHHQVHEGETFRIMDQQLSLGTGTVKYGITVPVFTPANATKCPHMLCEVDVYNGSARVDCYEGATFTGGTAKTAYNVDRNSINTPVTSIKTGITSTDGTLISSFFAGGGLRAAGGNRSESEWLLKSNTIYRLDVVGLVAGTQAIVRFAWYEDLGV